MRQRINSSGDGDSAASTVSAARNPWPWKTAAMAVAIATFWLGSASAQQVLSNADFDSDLAQWDLPSGLGSASWSGDDSEGSVSSGSAIVITTTGQGTGESIDQCHQAAGSTPFRVGADYRIPGGQTEPGAFAIIVQYFTSSTCADQDFISGTFFGVPQSPPTNVWLSTESYGESPPAAASLKVLFASRKSTGGVVGLPFEVNVDAAELVLLPGLIFGDGLEDGGVTGWSSATFSRTWSE